MERREKWLLRFVLSRHAGGQENDRWRVPRDIEELPEKYAEQWNALVDKLLSQNRVQRRGYNDVAGSVVLEVDEKIPRMLGLENQRPEDVTPDLKRELKRLRQQAEAEEEDLEERREEIHQKLQTVEECLSRIREERKEIESELEAAENTLTEKFDEIEDFLQSKPAISRDTLTAFLNREEA